MLKWGNKIKFLVEPDFSHFLPMAETGLKEESPEMINFSGPIMSLNDLFSQKGSPLYL